VADRTAQMQAARAEAERQRARLARFFMQAPAAICILDGPTLVHELVNSGYQALLRGRALLDRPLLEALPEIAGHVVYQTFREVYETGITHEEPALLIPLARPDDGVLEDRYFNYIQQARYGENGQIDGILVFALEVTAQVLAQQRADTLQAQALQAAEALVRQRENLYQLFEQTPASVAILRGSAHYFDYLNLGYQAMFPGRELLHRPLAEALPEVVEFGFVALLDQVLRTGEPYFGTEQPLRMRTESGQLIDSYYTFSCQLYREAGEIVGVSILAFEVTLQVQARQQAVALQAEVSRRDAQLQAVFEQAPVAIAVLRGPAFIVELANPGMCELWGHPHEDVLGKPLLTGVPELRGQAFDQLLEGVMATGTVYAAQE
jgi:PAS domain-containing protein